MGPKYEFTGETMTYDCHILHRIERLSDGKLGGWIESEDNLSQEGNCWVDDDSKVYDNARVSDNVEVFGNACVYNGARIFNNAYVYDNAKVYGNAEVYGEAKISGYAKVYGCALVYDNAEVYDNAKVYDNAQVCGHAWVHSNAKVYDNAQVYGWARVYGNAQVYDNAQVYGSAWISGDAWVEGNVQVYGDVKVYGDAHVYGDLRVNRGELTFREYNEDFQNKASSKEVVQDFIYKVDNSNKITTQTEYDSIEEFFIEPITNDVKLDTLVICTIDTKEPLIKLQKVEKENKLNYRFIVDITIDNGDNFSIKSTIETQEQLNQKLEQTIEALKQYPEFAKYVDDLESCL